VQGVIEARSTLHVPLDVTAQELEEQETTAHFVIVGSLGFSLVSLHFVDSPSWLDTNHPITSTLQQLRCDVGLEEENINRIVSMLQLYVPL